MPKKVTAAKEQEPVAPSSAPAPDARAAIASVPQSAPVASDVDARMAHLEAENQKLQGMIKQMLQRDEERVAAEAKAKADEAARIADLPPPEWQIEVVAYNQGTYPEPGAMHAWLRNPGDRFKIKDASHFRPEWMTYPGVEPKLDTKREIAGHGPGFTPGVGIPLTGVQNQVKDPMQAINDATRAAMAR